MERERGKRLKCALSRLASFKTGVGSVMYSLGIRGRGAVRGACLKLVASLVQPSISHCSPPDAKRWDISASPVWA